MTNCGKSPEILNADCKNKIKHNSYFEKSTIMAFHRCFMDKLKISTFRCLQIIIVP